MVPAICRRIYIRAEINYIPTIFFCLVIQFNSTTALETNVREQYAQEGVTRSS